MAGRGVPVRPNGCEVWAHVVETAGGLRMRLALGDRQWIGLDVGRLCLPTP